MHLGRLLPIFLLLPITVHLSPRARQSATTASTPQRDPDALTVLRQSVTTMGNSAPADVVASGNVSTTAGSLSENGNITIKMRGLDQTYEQLETPHGWTVVYSRGHGNLTHGSSSPTSLSYELAAGSQCADFPLQLMLAALSGADYSVSYVARETLDGASAHHIRMWNTFLSTPDLKHVSDFSAKEIWIDVTSGLPVKLDYSRRAASGAPAIPIEVRYSKYSNSSGFSYPSSIQISVDGTPWADITITSVSFNSGLGDNDFLIQ
jgi:hypothetical protein